MAKILHAAFTRQLGGLEQAYINYTRALVEAGHEVIALISPKAPYRDVVEAFGVEIRYMEPRGFYDFKTLMAARKLVKHLQPDLIIAHNSKPVSVLGHAKTGLKIPLVGVCHSSKVKRMASADLLFVLHEAMARHFIRYGWKQWQLAIIPNMIEVPPKRTSSSLHAPIALGTMGRLVPEKGLHDLIRACAHLKEKGVDFTLHIAGEGPERAHLERMVQQAKMEDRVTWHGWVSDKARFFDGIDLFVFPSVQESFGLAALEAAAHGVPVIACDAEGPANLFTHGENALITARNNPPQLAAAMETLMNDAALRESLAEQGYQLAQHFTPENIIKMIQENVSYIVKQKPGEKGAGEAEEDERNVAEGAEEGAKAS